MQVYCSAVEPVGHDTTELHQQDVEQSDAKKLKSIQELYAKTKPVLHDSQPIQMSTSRTEPEEITKVVDSGIFLNLFEG